jgi:uncharacterized protein YjcR
MRSVFQKYGGIRPMAAKLGVPPSTVKSWHAKREIPSWRRQAVVDTAHEHGIDLSFDEVETVLEDEPEPSQAAA